MKPKRRRPLSELQGRPLSLQERYIAAMLHSGMPFPKPFRPLQRVKRAP